MEKIPPNYTGIIQRSDSTDYYVEGKLSRVGGPASQSIHGISIWAFKGKRHNTEGTAFVFDTGTKFWFILDELINNKSVMLLVT